MFMLNKISESESESMVCKSSIHHWLFTNLQHSYAISLSFGRNIRKLYYC